MLELTERERKQFKNAQSSYGGLGCIGMAGMFVLSLAALLIFESYQVTFNDANPWMAGLRIVLAVILYVLMGWVYRSHCKLMLRAIDHALGEDKGEE